MNAIFSLVPTPSALETSTGSAIPAQSSWNNPPKEPMLGEHARGERRCARGRGCGGRLRCRLRCRRPPADNPFRTRAFESMRQRPCARRSGGGLSSTCAARRRRSAPPRNPLRACRRLPAAILDAAGSFCFSITFSINGGLRSATVPTASAIAARAGSWSDRPFRAASRAPLRSGFGQ